MGACVVAKGIQSRIQTEGEAAATAWKVSVRADGMTPKLKIESDSWYVSYDDGATWTPLGSAGSGIGDSMFQEIRQDDNYVYFILADGEEIKLAKTHSLTWVYV